MLRFGPGNPAPKQEPNLPSVGTWFGHLECELLILCSLSFCYVAST